MTTIEFITELFYRVDNALPDAQKHSQAHLFPSEVVTIAILFALKGVAIGRSIGGSFGTICPCFLSCLIGRGCFGCSTPINIGPSV